MIVPTGRGSDDEDGPERHGDERGARGGAAALPRAEAPPPPPAAGRQKASVPLAPGAWAQSGCDLPDCSCDFAHEHLAQ